MCLSLQAGRGPGSLLASAGMPGRGRLWAWLCQPVCPCRPVRLLPGLRSGPAETGPSRRAHPQPPPGVTLGGRRRGTKVAAGGGGQARRAQGWGGGGQRQGEGHEEVEEGRSAPAWELPTRSPKEAQQEQRLGGALLPESRERMGSWSGYPRARWGGRGGEGRRGVRLRPRGRERLCCVRGTGQ